MSSYDRDKVALAFLIFEFYNHDKVCKAFADASIPEELGAAVPHAGICAGSVE